MTMRFYNKHLCFLTTCMMLTACSATQETTEALIVKDSPSEWILLECSSDEEGSYCAAPDEGVAELIHPVPNVQLPTLVAFESDSGKESGLEKNLWMHVANQLELTRPSNQPRLEAQKNWYLRHPDYMQRVSNRAAPFLYYVVKQLEQHDMPLDLALLPIVESAFDPFAYSHGRASGMWQFIPGTGKRFGMPQDWWYDGRRDVIASTQGAIDYLTYLHKFFDGNWLHALAAYNSGEGRVKRAIRKNQKANKPTDFWSLDLPRETRAYVPKLLALADILKRQKDYNFNWPVVENAPVVEVVTVAHQIDLAKAAGFAGLTVEELQALNPGFNRWATPPRASKLLLPKDRAQAFETALENTPQNEFVTWKRHKIRPGESLGVIAQKYTTTSTLIKELNNIKGNRIIAGDFLLIPVAQTDLDNYPLSSSERSAALTRNVAKTHIVREGDTLWDIAVANGISVKTLAAWNKMAPRDTLKVGSELVVAKGSASQSRQTRNIRYSVRSGDSLSRIAGKFKVKVTDIVRWNNLQGQKYLQPGQVLKLVIDLTNS